jgi:PAS domain S-box-containing protein
MNQLTAEKKETLNSIPLSEVKGLFEVPIELRSIMDELAMGIVIMDRESRILFMNRGLEVLTGFLRDEVWGVPSRHVLRFSTSGPDCPLIRAERDKSTIIAEGNIINRDRQKIPVRLSATSLYDRKGHIVGFMETMENLRHALGAEDSVQQRDSLSQIIGRSAKMRELFRLVPVVAQTDSSLLITGETGTGKDVLAEAIHNSSDRADGPFVKINCGALPETLLESELFGHKKGAFTGSVNDKMGRLKLANQGTLYLTEIGDLPLPLQVKFLTFLDDKIVYPLGSTDGFQADVRIIAATHRNLERMVKDGLFRQDLLFRLNVVRFHLPPLRERGEDINLLLDHFLKLFITRFEKQIKGFSISAHRFLLNYSYPGNVRELRNIIEYIASICSSDTIGMEHLPGYLFDEKSVYDESDYETPREIQAGHQLQDFSDGLSWANIERQYIIETLLKVHGHKSKAAEILGWGRTTLWRKMKQYGLDQ